MIKIQYDARKNKDWLNAMERKQLPFAISYSLNQTAIKATHGAKKQVEKRLDVKKKWALNQIKVVKSNKKDIPIEAGVDINSTVLSAIETGMTLTASGSKEFAVPLDGIKRPTRSNTPSKLLQKKNVRIVSGKKSPVVIKQKSRKSSVLLYALKKKIKIPKKLDIQNLVERMSYGLYQREFDAAFSMAMRTAKKD